MVPSNNPSPEVSDSRSKVLCVTDWLTAEHIRLVLAFNEIRAAVIQQDPLRVLAASAEVVVSAADLARAQDAIEDMLLASRTDEWNCPACGEIVPCAFDFCWNCGSDATSPAPISDTTSKTFLTGFTG